VARLLELRLLDDLALAKTLARHKWRVAKWGAPRIKMALAARRVPPAEAAAALQELFAEDGDAGGAAAEDALLQACRRRWQLSRNLAFEARAEQRCFFAHAVCVRAAADAPCARRRASGGWWAGCRGAGTAGAWRATSSWRCRAKRKMRRRRTSDAAVQDALLPCSAGAWPRRACGLDTRWHGALATALARAQLLSCGSALWRRSGQ
jgi:hypothetical protein